MSKPLSWFLERVGKRIYRLTDTKCCHNCDEVMRTGLEVNSVAHAHYLYDCQNEMELVYSDSKETL